MKKVLITLFSIILIYIVIRFSFSYTVINLPFMFGMSVYSGGSKYDFPKCIVNQLKIKPIKEKIIDFAEYTLKKENQYSAEEIQAINYKQAYDKMK